MRKLLTLFLLAFCNWIFAQHCPFDGSAIIVLNIHNENSSAIIPGLKIYLEDSAGNPYSTYQYKNQKYAKDIALFWQNPDHTTFKGYIDNNNPAEPEKIRFPFARNNYVLTTYDGFPLDQYKIVIEDADAVKNGLFETKIITLGKQDVYPLCTTYNKEVYNCPFKKVIYTPADVILAKQK